MKMRTLIILCLVGVSLAWPVDMTKNHWLNPQMSRANIQANKEGVIRQSKENNGIFRIFEQIMQRWKQEMADIQNAFMEGTGRALYNSERKLDESESKIKQRSETDKKQYPGGKFGPSTENKEPTGSFDQQSRARNKSGPKKMVEGSYIDKAMTEVGLKEGMSVEGAAPRPRTKPDKGKTIEDAIENDRLLSDDDGKRKVRIGNGKMVGEKNDDMANERTNNIEMTSDNVNGRTREKTDDAKKVGGGVTDGTTDGKNRDDSLAEENRKTRSRSKTDAKKVGDIVKEANQTNEVDSKKKTLTGEGKRVQKMGNATGK